MVVFSCDGCAEVLKKNQVDAHANRCRNCASVSCADCMVSFFGDDYRSHTTCMTEAERYEKSIYRPSSKKMMKRNPQEAWMDLIEQACHDDVVTPAALKPYLKTLASLGNVPRKEKQFRNFAANSLNLAAGGGGVSRGKAQVEIVNALWNFLSELRQKGSNERKQEQEREAVEKKERDRKQREERESEEMKVNISKKSDEETPISSKELPSSKIVRKTMKKILKKEKSGMKLKLLKTRVSDALGLDKSFTKKLKKMLQMELDVEDSKIKVNGKLVQLV